MSEIKVKVEQKPPQRVGVKLGISYAEDPTLTEQLDKLNGEVVGISSSAKIAAASASKQAIKKAIADRGGEIGDDTPLSEYDKAVWSIKTSGERIPGKHRVRFFDYDGTILKTVYTDGGAVQAPAVPDHERLLFQEWNNDFDNITDDLDVGAIYTTKSGKCEFDVWINAELTPAPNTAYMNIDLASGTVTVEWGDGATETLSTAGVTRLSHTYASAGKYMISVSGTDGWAFGNCPTSHANDEMEVYVTAMRIANTPPCHNWINMQYGGHGACRTMSFDNKSFAGIVNNNPFYSSQSLVHFNHPTTLVRNGMFRGAICLKHIVLKSTMTAFENHVFRNTGLEDIVLPKDLVTLNYGALGDDENRLRITELTIPGKVSDMTDALGLSNYRRGFLTTLKMKPVTPPLVSVNITDGFGSLKEIIVPAGCGEAYKSATNWSYYADIIREEEI